MTSNPVAPRAGLDPGSAPRSAAGPVPFGTHIRMAWWRALIVIAAIPLTLLLLQLGFYLLAGLIGGGDPFASTLTPLKLLAANLSTGLTAVLAVVLVARFSGVPWRSVFSSPRRFDPRRLAIYCAGSVVLVAAGTAVVAAVAPDATGWVGFGFGGTTVALLAVVILSTPIQSAGEEIMFRGAVLPAAASWFRAVRPAFITGLVVSSLSFAAVHAAVTAGSAATTCSSRPARPSWACSPVAWRPRSPSTWPTTWSPRPSTCSWPAAAPWSSTAPPARAADPH